MALSSKVFSFTFVIGMTCIMLVRKTHSASFAVVGSRRSFWNKKINTNNLSSRGIVQYASSSRRTIQQAIPSGTRFFRTGSARNSRATFSTELASGWKNIEFDEMNVPAQNYTTNHDFRVVDKVDLRPVVSPLKPSPVEIVTIRGRQVYLKRDDLLRLEGSRVSGNKARKMLALNQIPAEDFPKCVVSYGGSQSNAMLALSAIVQSKNKQATMEQLLHPNAGDEKENDDDFDNDEVDAFDDIDIVESGFQQVAGKAEHRFVYYTKKIPRFLKKNPSGNYFRAKSLGMEVIELSQDEYNHLFGGEHGGKAYPPKDLPIPVTGDSLWIPQGGACGYAIPGCRLLATEILNFWRLRGNGRPLTVFIPGGTCSTAFVVHRELQRLQDESNVSNQMDIEIVVIPCVGDDGYAERQMMALNVATGGTGKQNEIPRVLKPAPLESFYHDDDEEFRYFRFGEPDVDILNCFREMDASGVNVDLLYGAPSWHVLLRHWSVDKDAGRNDFLTGREIMYVHSGGLEGINSQLMRYRHKGLIEGNEVQHPERQRRASKDFLEEKSGLS